MLIAGTLAACNTIPNAAYSDPDVTVLKELGYVAGVSSALGGNKDQVKAQIDRYAQSKGYTGWQDVAFQAAQAIANMSDLPPAVAAELRTLFNMLQFFSDNGTDYAAMAKV